MENSKYEHIQILNELYENNTLEKELIDYYIENHKLDENILINIIQNNNNVKNNYSLLEKILITKIKNDINNNYLLEIKNKIKARKNEYKQLYNIIKLLIIKNVSFILDNPYGVQESSVLIENIIDILTNYSYPYIIL
jgi:hypothetical protein